jgi:membrane protease YdiL (CAAX protease family)
MIGLRAVHFTGVVWRTRTLEIGAFLALTIVGSWPLMLAGSPPALALAMWVPALVALLLTRAAGERAVERFGLDRLGWADAYFGAIWMPILFAVGGIALTVQLGAGRIDPDVGGLLPANGAGPVGDAVQEVVGSLTLAPLVNTVVMVGAEIGWRAYLIPLLLPFGAWRAIAITAALWSAWQLPLAFGISGPDAQLMVVVQVIWCVLIGAILGWLYVRTRSAWAPALFSGAIGATSGFWPLFLRDASPVLAGQVSIIGLVVPALVLVALPWIHRTD